MLSLASNYRVRELANSVDFYLFHPLPRDEARYTLRLSCGSHVALFVGSLDSALRVRHLEASLNDNRPDPDGPFICQGPEYWRRQSLRPPGSWRMWSRCYRTNFRMEVATQMGSRAGSRAKGRYSWNSIGKQLNCNNTNAQAEQWPSTVIGDERRVGYVTCPAIPPAGVGQALSFHCLAGVA